MKKIQQFLLAIAVLLSSHISLSGQDSTSTFQLGIGVNGLLSIDHFEPFQIGMGTEVQLWLNKSINEVSSIDFTMAYRQLPGDQRKYINTEVQNHPDETIVMMKTKELASLYFLDASLNWQFQFSQDAPWFFGLGLRASRLINWKGHEQQIIWATDDGPIHEDNLQEQVDFNVRMNESTPMSANNFNRQDYGIQVYAGFEIIAGLKLKTSFYQGFKNVFSNAIFSDGSKYRITSFSLGLSARLF